MKNSLFLSILLLFIITVNAQTNTGIPPRADTLYNKLMAAANPVKKNWVYKTAIKYRGKEITELKAMNEVTNASSILGKMSEGNIEALAFLVLMQASKSAEEDLRNMMAGIKTTNNAKANQRDQIQDYQNKKNETLLKTRDEYSVLKKDSVKIITINPAFKIQATGKDNLNEMDQQQQLRLQMVMDRKQKTTEAISNLLKKIADTEQEIIQNIK